MTHRSYQPNKTLACEVCVHILSRLALVEFHHVFRGLLIRILVKLQKTQPYIFHIFVRILLKIVPINYKIGGGGGGGGVELCRTRTFQPLVSGCPHEIRSIVT